MKSNLSVAPTFTSGLLETSTGSISDISKMFDLLATNLYSNRPLAIVRELTCNAWDASPGNIEVFGPTPLHPFLTIKDNGPGMSHEDVMGHYLSLGYSTKEDTNAQVGRFGLGCKAPFSYTDAFSVESRQNGVKRIYSMFKEGVPTGRTAPDGTPVLKPMPKVALVGTTPVDEPDGLTVIVPILEKDFNAFNQSIKSFLWRFKPAPKTNVALQAPQYLIDTPTWRMRGTKQTPYPERRPVAVMGNVPYPIDRAALGDYSEVEDLFQLAIDIEFPIGAVEPAPNRESLTYDSYTITAVKARLKQVNDEIITYLVKALETAPTPWERALLMSDWIDEGLPWAIRDRLKKATTYSETLRISGPEVTSCFAEIPKRGIYAKVSLHEACTFIPERVRSVYLWDETISVGRNKGRLRHAGIDDALILRGPPDVALKLAGSPPAHMVYRIADLADPRYRGVERGERRKTKLKLISAGWLEVDEPDEGGLYIELNGDYSIDRGYNHGTLQLMMRFIGEARTPIFGIPRSCAHVLKKPGWTHLEDYVLPKFKELAKSRAVAEAVQAAEALTKCRTRDFFAVTTGLKHPAYKLFLQLSAKSKTVPDARGIVDLATRCGFRVAKLRSTVKTELFDRFVERYPLIVHYTPKTELKHWESYCK